MDAPIAHRKLMDAIFGDHSEVSEAEARQKAAMRSGITRDEFPELARELEAFELTRKSGNNLIRRDRVFP